MILETQTIDHLFLELSQFTQAKTKREIELELALNRAELEAEETEATHMWLDDMSVTRLDDHQEEYSLVGRIQVLIGTIKK